MVGPNVNIVVTVVVTVKQEVNFFVGIARRVQITYAIISLKQISLGINM